MKTNQPTEQRPAQQQELPGTEKKMQPLPKSHPIQSKGSDKLKNQVALITGGDSGIGKAVALAFAQEGANVSIVYLSEHEDAQKTKALVEELGQKCLLIAGDISEEDVCQKAVEQTINQFGRLDILVNNAAEQHPQKSIENISKQQLEKTFATNIFSYFYMVKAALKELTKNKGKIINTTSVTAYRGSKELLDYSATKGAIVAFTRSLSLALIEQGIRVNGVAPGPIWTPLIPATFPEDKVKTFGSDVPMKRAGEPAEVAPCYVFLASNDSSYISGQILHPNGGEIINT